jgi:hypothetical protein
MKLPDKKIIKLQEIYRKKYGEEISIEEAEKFGMYLVQLLRTVYEI